MKTEISIISDLSENTDLDTLSVRNNIDIDRTGISFNLILIAPKAKQGEYKFFFPNCTFINSDSNKVVSLNNALRKAETQFVCYLPKNIHLDFNWLYDLYYYMTNIDSSGFISICSSLTRGYDFPLLNNSDKLISCYKPDYICDLFFSDFDIIKLIGAFEEKEEINNSIAMYSLMVKSKGLHAYNIPFQTAIKIEDDKPNVDLDLLITKNKETKYLPLYKRSEKHEQAFLLLTNLVLTISSQTTIFEHTSTANFGFKTPILLEDDVSKLKDYSTTFDLTFVISCGLDNNLKVTFFNLK